MGNGFYNVQEGGCAMLQEIKLYGKLAKFVGQRSFQAAVSNAAEAIRFLLANFPGLEQHMADQHYKVLVGDWSLTLDEIHNPAGQQVIKIVPVVGGAGWNRHSACRNWLGSSGYFAGARWRWIFGFGCWRLYIYDWYCFGHGRRYQFWHYGVFVGFINCTGQYWCCTGTWRRRADDCPNALDRIS